MLKILLIIFISFMIVQISYAQSISPDLRKPNNYEEFYYKIAIENNAADICGKISPKAYSNAGFAPPGYQIWYQRSECYYTIAEQTMDGTLCDNVKSLGVITTSWEGMSISQDGSKYSKQGCLENVATYVKISKKPGHTAMLIPEGIFLSKDLLIPIFSEMGYTKDNMPFRYKREIYNTYETVFHDPREGIDELIARVRKLPNFE